MQGVVERVMDLDAHRSTDGQVPFLFALDAPHQGSSPSPLFLLFSTRYWNSSFVVVIVSLSHVPKGLTVHSRYGSIDSEVLDRIRQGELESHVRTHAMLNRLWNVCWRGLLYSVCHWRGLRASGRRSANGQCLTGVRPLRESAQ